MTCDIQARARCQELQALSSRIGKAGDPDAVVEAAAECRRFCAGWAGEDVGGAWLTRTLSQLNDCVVDRLIRLTAAEHRLPTVPWCWIALGSEGRFEQTFTSDQDNGFIFSAADSRETEPLRQLFLPFAQAVNERLDRCGFAFCNGGVMAGNPKWCLSLDEWRQCFADWVRKPEPMALMHATIFFDFRALHGDQQLAERLRKWLLALTRDTPAVLHLMAANALQSHPPLGFLGDVVKAPAGEGSMVDLKKVGARIFVDAARIFALAHGVARVDTVGRLTEAGAAAGLLPKEIGAATDAFSHVLRLRLGRQVQTLATGRQPDHLIDPDELHDLDHVILRESLRQAKRLQQRLKLNYVL